jgi:hypothetical protein
MKGEFYLEIKLKNYEIINAFKNIGELMEEKLPTQIQWNINKNLKKITTAFNNYIEFKQELVKKYALKDDKNNIKFDDNDQPLFPPKSRNEFITERNELINCEDSLDITMINLSDLQNVNIKGTTLLALEFMINDDMCNE